MEPSELARRQKLANAPSPTSKKSSKDEPEGPEVQVKPNKGWVDADYGKPSKYEELNDKHVKNIHGAMDRFHDKHDAAKSSLEDRNKAGEEFVKDYSGAYKLNDNDVGDIVRKHWARRIDKQKFPHGATDSPEEKSKQDDVNKKYGLSETMSETRLMGIALPDAVYDSIKEILNKD
jgi:hypothetical protein